MAGERGTNRPPNRPLSDVLHRAADLERRNAMEVDRPKLVNQDQAVLRLSCMATRDGHLPGIPRRPRRDRADRRASGSVERLIGHDKRSAAALLLVSHGRIEINDDDRPAERGGCHAGQRSGSSNVAAISAVSRWNSGSWAASAQAFASSSSRRPRSSSSTAGRPPRPATSRIARRVRGRALPSRAEGCRSVSYVLPCTHDRRVRNTCQGNGIGEHLTRPDVRRDECDPTRRWRGPRCADTKILNAL